MRHLIITAIVALLAVQAGAATLTTSAQVVLVPPVEVNLVAPAASDGTTTWRVDSAGDLPWQMNLETRDLDGNVLETRPAVPWDSPTSDQELTTFGGPATAHTSTPVVLTLVLCRE